MKPVGYMILKGVHHKFQNLEIMRIAVSDKQKGYGKEAMSLAKQVAFGQMKVHRLWLDVHEDNRPAQRLYESLGFRYEGTLRDVVKFDDQYASMRIYSILATELS